MENELKEIIKKICCIYNEFYDQGHLEINLKKCRCDKIYINDKLETKFKKNLDRYLDNLSLIYDKIYITCLEHEHIFEGLRKKHYDSILNKLIKNSNEKIVVLKILNDLLGIRFCLENLYQYEEGLKTYCETNGHKILKRKIIRGDNIYRALHVYIKGKDNYIFNIEIQFWDKNDKEKNFKSHEVYKQKYIEAPSHYKGGEHI